MTVGAEGLPEDPSAQRRAVPQDGSEIVSPLGILGEIAGESVDRGAMVSEVRVAGGQCLFVSLKNGLAGPRGNIGGAPCEFYHPGRAGTVWPRLHS